MTLKQACLLMATVAFFVNCDFQFQEYTSMVAQPPKNERTCFQTNAPWDARIDLQSDVAIIYSNTDTARMREKIDTWRDKGYTIHVMTAVGRGAQNDYVSGNWQAVDGNTDGQDHSADIQLGGRWREIRSRIILHSLLYRADAESHRISQTRRKRCHRLRRESFAFGGTRILGRRRLQRWI